MNKSEIRTLEKRSGLSIHIKRLGDVGNWTVVRNAGFAQAMPFVISRKDWDKCAVMRPPIGEIG